MGNSFQSSDDARTRRERAFTRRSIMLGGVGLAVFGGLASRMWSLQVVRTEEFANLSADNQFNLRAVPPPRGRIMDRYGVVIADNDPTFQVLVVPEQIPDVDAVLHELARLIAPPNQVAGSAARRAALVTRWARLIDRARRFDEVTLEDAIDWEAYARISVRRPSLPGVIAERGAVRAYGLPALSEGGQRRSADAFAHLVGYVAKPTEEDVNERLDAVRDASERAGLARILRNPGFRAGRAGIEETMDPVLQGEWGNRRVEVDAYGRTIRELGVENPATPGADVRLSVDAELQARAQEVLAGESGAVVGLDILSGDILCLASAPGFDPNLFAGGINTPAFRALRNDERAPLFNKPLAGLYPPGSTFKMISALAALRWGIMDPGERIFCNGSMVVGDREFHCWKHRGHGAMDMRDGIKQSCDVYYYELARRFEIAAVRGEIPFDRGIDAISQEAGRFGLGPAFDLAAPGSRNGLLPTAAWKRARFDEPWSTGETLSCAIGQSFVSASPLQLAVMTARLASGRAITPRIVHEPAESPLAQAERARREDTGPLAAEEHLELMRSAMYGVVEEAGGTAYWSLNARGVDVPGARMAGKTGTSQVRRITKEEREAGVIKNEDLPWRRRDHALFVGYAPYVNPRFAITVVVDHGGSGSSTASPPARAMLKHMLERDASWRTAAVGANQEPG